MQYKKLQINLNCWWGFVNFYTYKNVVVWTDTIKGFIEWILLFHLNGSLLTELIAVIFIYVFRNHQIYICKVVHSLLLSNTATFMQKTL